MQQYKIFPSIGIARVGGSLNDFFIGPESQNSPGLEIQPGGAETALKLYKDGTGLIKRQGARFQVLHLDGASGQYLPAQLPVTARITWTVQLVNKKAAVQRPSRPPATPVPIKLKPGGQNQVIDSGTQSIGGKNAPSVVLNQGLYMGAPVTLGELRTDINGNLIVLGGSGISNSPSDGPIGASFYNNGDWHDDVSDGFVKAMVDLGDGSPLQEADAAWVIVTPPDFAPGIKGVVTLYDIMQQTAVNAGSLQLPSTLSFASDIWPLIQKYSGLQWVNTSLNWNITQTPVALSNNTPANKTLRTNVKEQVFGIQEVLSQFSFTAIQQNHLNEWANGNCADDFANPPVVNTNTGDYLTRVVLDGTVGQGFFPGIEGGIIVSNPAIYKEAFRLDPAKVLPGDITALMAQPWQADFLKCSGAWWPSQRPDSVFLANGTRADWGQGIAGHKDLVNNFNKLGFVEPKTTINGTAYAEEERSLPR